MPSVLVSKLTLSMLTNSRCHYQSLYGL